MSEFKTDFVSLVLKAYHRLTKYIPKPIPETADDFNRLKEILLLYFGVEDSSVGWITVASEVQNTRTKFLRKPYYLYANAMRKIEINGMAENQKRLEGAKLTARLKEISEKIAKDGTNESMPEGSPDLESQMQILPRD